MQSLFWRVFAWYLGTTVVVLALALGVWFLLERGVTPRSAVSVSQEAVRDNAKTAVQAWQSGKELTPHRSTARASNPRFLFDGAGRQLAGAPVPPGLGDLLSRAETSSAIEIEFIPPNAFAAIRVAAGGSKFIYVEALPRSDRFRILPRPLPGWARIALGLIIASSVSLLVAHYVTSPLRKLRSATRELASGNLQARIGNAKPFHRKDEFADLARDFDNMATKIQHLLLTQHRMLGDISHELRSPLTRLQLALEIARRKVAPGSEEILNRIEQEADKMNALIGQILRAVQTQHANPGVRTLFDLANLVREIAEDADFEASAKERRVRVLQSDLSLIHGDRELLRSAIENVIRNAIRYTPGHTDVTIELTKNSSERATVIVRDCGPGVPAEAIAHIFEPFYRVHSARERESGGAGLGLAITQHVISAHGGAVQARNRQEGGFEVRIELPVKMPDAPSRNKMKFRTS